VLSGAFSLLTLGIKGLAVGIGAVVLTVGKAIQTLGAFSKSIRDISAATGLSKLAAGGVQSRFGAMGIDASATFGEQNPAVFGMKAAAWNLPSYDDPRFQTQLATRYQHLQSQGATGAIMSRQMLSSLNIDTEPVRRMASTPVNEIRRQEGFARTVHAGLGINPESIATVGRQFEQLQAQFKILGEGVLVRIAQEVLPYLNGVLGALTARLNGMGPAIAR
jgi:hypothetical protein